MPIPIGFSAPFYTNSVAHNTTSVNFLVGSSEQIQENHDSSTVVPNTSSSKAFLSQTQSPHYTNSIANYVAALSTVQYVFWYMDLGATDHVTADLSQLTINSNYIGNEQLQVGNGELLPISHTGFTYLSCQSRSPYLKHVLCVLNITKNLLSISTFTKDNGVIVEFFANHCVVKDKQSKVDLLQGRLKDGLHELQTPAAPKSTLLANSAKPTVTAFNSSTRTFNKD